MNNFNATCQHQDSLNFMTPRHQMDYESHFDEQDEEIRMLNQEFREGKAPTIAKQDINEGERKKRFSDNDRVTVRVPLLLTSALLSLPFERKQ
jgi:hypothetical protein